MILNRLLNGFLLLFLCTVFVPLSAFSQTPENVVGWSTWSNWSNRTAEQGITGNISTSVINTVGTNTPLISDADGTGQRAFADGWASGANSKAWTFSFSTTKYNTLRFACKLMSTNSPSNFLGPRDFKLQYSLNNSTWTDVSGGTMTAYNGYPGWSYYSNISLPAACENQSTVYLRLLMTSNTAVNGGTVNGGQSHIDDLVITGTSIPEAPTDLSLSSSALMLPSAGTQAGSGTAVGLFSSADFNLGNTHTYTLVSGTGSTNNASFGISGASLSVATALSAGTYSIRVRSTDNSGLFFEKVFTVLVSAPDAILSGTKVRLSAMGTNGSTAFAANAPPSIAYNSTNNEYLLVWAGDDNTSPLVDNEMEVFAQRINATTGAASGSRVRVSFMGTDGTTTHSAANPTVAWNATNNEYFIVWQGDHNSGSLVSNEFEIWGRRMDGATGALLGSMVRISAMGPDGNAAFDATNPDVAWSVTDNQYLVVWRSDDNTAPLVDNEFDVYAQRVSNTGTLSGSRVQVSSMGTAGSTSFIALTPAVAWNATNNEFMVVWQGDDNTAPLVDNENEIFAQRISSTGALTGARIRVSSMGPDGNTAYNAFAPDIVWNSTDNEYLVVWRGDDNTAPLVDNEFEIFGQRLSNTGTLTGARIRISDMGPDGNTGFVANNPKVAYHSGLKEYWVVWSGDDNLTSIDNEFEIFMQRLTATGSETGNNDIRVSYMGTNNSTSFTALQPAIAYNSTTASAFAVWQGDDNTAPLVDNEMEVFGQALNTVQNTMPVRWRSFSAALQPAGSVQLHWETEDESNTDYFVVQHSDGRGAWKSIDTAKARGTAGTQRYGAVHTSPLKGANYYRLLQVDRDGKKAYSKIVTVTVNGGAMVLYPNPVVDELRVQLPSPATSSLILYNSAGVMVMKKQQHGNLFSVSLHHLPAGQYAVTVLQEGVSWQQSVIKN